MKKLIIFTVFIISSFVTSGQASKKPIKKVNPRNYNGCVTRMDSIVRKATWMATDSMRVHGYVKD